MLVLVYAHVLIGAMGLRFRESALYRGTLLARLAGEGIIMDERKPIDNPPVQRGRREAPREGDGANEPGQELGIEPRRPWTMPRAEDDSITFARSPEFHDRRPKRR